MKKADAPIVIEQEFDRSVSDVWYAITRINEMRKWYFENLPGFRAEVGFTTEFAVESGGRTFIHLWTVTEVEPQRRVVYNWRYEGLPGDSYVTFKVSGPAEFSRLTVTARVVEDFPEDIPEFRRESCLIGWTDFIQNRLKAYLDD